MDLHERYGLRRVVNAYDKATSLGSALVHPDIAEVVMACLDHPFELGGMQDVAGRMIARALGSEYGGVTACAAAGITLGVAAAMTGKDAARIAQLPDTTGMSDRIVLQQGHAINFGAPVAQMIRLAGATVVEVGDVSSASHAMVRRELDRGNVAAIVAVESYHTAGYAGVPLPQLADIAHEYDIPLIVDAATQELRIPEIVASGADLVVCSAHKYFQATTAGVMAGRRTLIEAALLQNQGIGRGMKPGKEAIFGVIAAMELYMERDLEEWTAGEQRKLDIILQRLGDVRGLSLSLSPDPNGCPFNRIEAEIDTETTGYTAETVQRVLAGGDPAVWIRVYNRDSGRFFINATEMSDEDIEILCARIRELLGPEK